MERRAASFSKLAEMRYSSEASSLVPTAREARGSKLYECLNPELALAPLL